jgi:hypothetical protein
MPQVTGTTILGNNINVTLNLDPVTQLLLYFPRPLINALTNKPVGRLRLVYADTNALVTVYQWEVYYPGIWPAYYTPLRTPNLQAVFECWRPGLPWVFFWNA